MDENIEKFVDRHISENQTLLVNELFNRNILDIDDIYGSGYSSEQEVYEWWIVSDWFLDKLRAEGEITLITEYGKWWGRTTTGQALYMDDVVKKIYKKVRR